MQIQVMKRLHDHGVRSPKPIPLRPPNVYRDIYRTTNNPLKNEKNSTDIQRKVNVHCMSYIDGGILAADVDQTDMSFLQNLGEFIGKLSVVLQGLKHEASEFYFEFSKTSEISCFSFSPKSLGIRPRNGIKRE